MNEERMNEFLYKKLKKRNELGGVLVTCMVRKEHVYITYLI